MDFMQHSKSEDDLTVELQREIRRLEAERSAAIDKRDLAKLVVESGDDTGRLLITALTDVRQLDERIEQMRQLLEKSRSRNDV